MLTACETQRLAEAYSDSCCVRAAVPNAIAGLQIVLAIALAGASYSEADAMRSAGVTAKPGATGR